jgi:hypothetical protein
MEKTAKFSQLVIAGPSTLLILFGMDNRPNLSKEANPLSLIFFSEEWRMMMNKKIIDALRSRCIDRLSIAMSYEGDWLTESDGTFTFQPAVRYDRPHCYVIKVGSDNVQIVHDWSYDDDDDVRQEGEETLTFTFDKFIEWAKENISSSFAKKIVNK